MNENFTSASGTQSVFLCIEHEDLEKLRRILDTDPMLVHARGPGPRSTGPEQAWTALQFAAARGDLECCRLLVERGAEVYTNPMNTYPPVLQAAWNKHQAVVDYFLSEIPERADGTNRLGVTINMAGRLGWTDIVRKHIEADPLAVYQRGWIGDMPLHWPSHNNSVEIVAMLLDAGAEIEADETNCYGGKPLHWASEHAPATVDLLIARGADPNSRNVKADSALHGMTPLIMNATQRDDCSEITERLLAAGADINATDASGKSALANARERGLNRIIAVLERHGAANPTS